MFKPSSEIIVKASFTMSSNENFKNQKHHIAANGEAVVSRQELEIMDWKLLNKKEN